MKVRCGKGNKESWVNTGDCTRGNDGRFGGGGGTWER